MGCIQCSPSTFPMLPPYPVIVLIFNMPFSFLLFSNTAALRCCATRLSATMSPDLGQWIQPWQWDPFAFCAVLSEAETSCIRIDVWGDIHWVGSQMNSNWAPRMCQSIFNIDLQSLLNQMPSLGNACWMQIIQSKSSWASFISRLNRSYMSPQGMSASM